MLSVKLNPKKYMLLIKFLPKCLKNQLRLIIELPNMFKHLRFQIFQKKNKIITKIPKISQKRSMKRDQKKLMSLEKAAT